MVPDAAWNGARYFVPEEDPQEWGPPNFGTPASFASVLLMTDAKIDCAAYHLSLGLVGTPLHALGAFLHGTVEQS